MKMLYVLVILGLVWSASGYSSGPPTSACVDMTPNHGVTADPSTPPFTITPSSDTYYSGQEITVTVSADDGMTLFKGFFIQARSAGSTDPVGSFSLGTETGIQTLSCSGGTGTNNGVTHDSSVEKASKAFTWSHEGDADIVFQATFVNNITTFWTGVTSNTLTAVNITETTTVAATTKSPNSSKGVHSDVLSLLLAVVFVFSF